MKQAFGAIFLALFAYYGYFVLSPKSDCDRIVNATAPISGIGAGFVAMMKPWSEPETIIDSRVTWLKFRIQASDFVRRQFVLKSKDEKLVCGFDTMVLKSTDGETWSLGQKEKSFWGSFFPGQESDEKPAEVEKPVFTGREAGKE